MPSEIRRPFFQDPGYLFFFFFLFCLVQSCSYALLLPFRHHLALLHCCGTGSWIAGAPFVLKAFAVGFLGFTIFGSSYVRVRLISRVSHWT